MQEFAARELAYRNHLVGQAGAQPVTYATHRLGVVLGPDQGGTLGRHRRQHQPVIGRTVHVNQVEGVHLQVVRERLAGLSACPPTVQAVRERLVEHEHAWQSTRLPIQTTARRRGDMHLMPGRQCGGKLPDIGRVPAAVVGVEVGEQQLQAWASMVVKQPSKGFATDEPSLAEPPAQAAFSP